MMRYSISASFTLASLLNCKTFTSLLAGEVENTVGGSVIEETHSLTAKPTNGVIKQPLRVNQLMTCS